MNNRLHPSLVAYLKRIASGRCGSQVIHSASVDGTDNMIHGTLALWDKLKADLGEAEASALVAAWLEKPWQLPQSK